MLTWFTYCDASAYLDRNLLSIFTVGITMVCALVPL
jgi:hypothetical protein